jgi:hypothetical protein
MSAVPPPNQQQPQAAPQPAASGPALPPTGLQQQLNSVNQLSAQAGVATNQGQVAPAPQSSQYGSTNLNQMAQRMAQSLGLNVGRGDLVDEQGNFLQTPEQIQAMKGGDYHGIGLQKTSAKMNMISSAITNEQNRQQQQKGIAAIQTGLGQVQSRARGSLASMQSGFYQDLADLYSNQEYEAADFSYFMQKGQMQWAEHQAHRARKAGRKSSRMGMIGSLAGAGIGAMTGIGAGAGAAIGGGAGQAGAAGGWF